MWRLNLLIWGRSWTVTIQQFDRKCWKIQHNVAAKRPSLRLHCKRWYPARIRLCHRQRCQQINRSCVFRDDSANSQILSINWLSIDWFSTQTFNRKLLSLILGCGIHTVDRLHCRLMRFPVRTPHHWNPEICSKCSKFEALQPPWNIFRGKLGIPLELFQLP